MCLIEDFINLYCRQQSQDIYYLYNMSRYTHLQLAVTRDTKTKILRILNEESVDWSDTDGEGNSLLHLAFRNKKFNVERLIGILRIFLDRGADINAKNKQEKTILHLAIECRSRDVIDFCLQNNADLDVKDKNGNSLAHFAVKQEHNKYRLFMRNPDNLRKPSEFENESSSFVEWMLSRGFDFFHTKNIDGKSPLYFTNDLDLQHVLLTLLKHVADLSDVEESQMPLLCAYLEKRNNFIIGIYNAIDIINLYRTDETFNIVKTILEKNKSIDDQTLDVAMRLAIEKKVQTDVVGILAKRLAGINIHKDCDNPEDRIAIAKALIPEGADINKKDDGPSRQTLASTLFRQNPTIEMLQALKEAGADFNKSTLGNNFLHDMIYIDEMSNDVEKLIDFLVNEGCCDVDLPNNRGETALKGAIAHSKIVMAKKLIEWKNNRTYLHVAAKRGAAKVVKLLIDSGADVNAKDNIGKTPLHFAMDTEVIRLLFSNGAIVDMQDNGGNTPMYDALLRANTNAIDELLKCGADIQDSKVFKLTLDKYIYGTNDVYDYKIFPYVKYYFVKLTALGFYDIDPLSFDDNLQIFFLKCQAEVELLKAYFLDECTSLYQLLHKNRNRRCAYADNEKLKNLAADRAIEKKFPNYFLSILGCYNDAVARKSLLEQASHALFQLTDVYLPDLCFDKIFEGFGNGDIACFLDAFKNNDDNRSTRLSK